MAVATFETDIAAGTAESVDRVFASTKELSAEDVDTALFACNFIQTLFRTARRSIENTLGQGVDAKAFAARYERAISTLDTVKGAVSRVLAKLKGSRLPARGEELISRYEDLDTDLASLRQFLLEALEKAKKPLRPIDWQRVRDVEEAYARGETKPFRKTAGMRDGS
ncbi:MAG: hypothetical protein ACYC3I_10250 [Gemmataceae bacterium]